MPLWIKPAGVPRVNPHHPLAKDLILCLVPEYGDLLTGTPPVPTDSNGTIASGELGYATKHSQAGGNSTGGVRYDLPSWAPLYGIGANWSAFTVAAITAIGSNYRALVGVPFQANGDNPYYGFSPFNAYGDTAQGVWVTVGGSLSYYNGISAWFTQDGAPHSYYVQSINGTLTMDRDGIQVDTGGTVSAGAPQIATNKQPLYLGCTTSLQLTPQAFASTIYLVFVFNRTLSAAERVALAQDPLALLDYGDGAGFPFAPSGGTVYTLTAAQGAFALTGQAAALRAQRQLAAAQGALVLSGQAAALRAQRRVAAAVGTLSLSGQTAALRAQRQLAASQGPFSLAGQAAGLRAQRQLVAGPGSFTLSGQPATLSLFRRLTAAVGTLVLSGQAVALRAQRRLPAGVGVFALSGQDVAFGVNGARSLAASTGIFTLSGQAAALRAQRRIAAAQGPFALTGQAAALRAQRQLAATTGTLVLSGQPAALRAARRLAAGTGTFVLAGQTVALLHGRTFQVSAGVFSLSGQAAAFNLARRLVAGTGLFDLVGVAASLVSSAAGGPMYCVLTIEELAEMGCVLEVEEAADMYVVLTVERI